MIVSVASGKGGTGKTTVALMLALGAETVQLVDCDVEEPNCHLFLKPQIEKVKTVKVSTLAIDKDRCNGCGACVAVCRFTALALAGGKIMVFPELCHSCGGCVLACEQKAIREVRRRIGEIQIGRGTSDYGQVDWVSGQIDPGTPAAGAVIRAVKGAMAVCENTVIDCPPGTSCSMVAAVQGSDVCLLVAEPTASGLHDLELAINVAKKIGQSHCAVIVNKSEVNEWRQRIWELCRKQAIPVLADIPYCRQWAAKYAGGVLPTAGATIGRQIWGEVRRIWPVQ